MFHSIWFYWVLDVSIVVKVCLCCGKCFCRVVSVWLHCCCNEWEGLCPLTPVNHTSWMNVVTPAGRPKSVNNRCVIEVLVAFLCCVVLFLHHCSSVRCWAAVTLCFWSRKYIFKHSYLCTLASRGTLPCVLGINLYIWNGTAGASSICWSLSWHSLPYFSLNIPTVEKDYATVGGTMAPYLVEKEGLQNWTNMIPL